GSPAGGEPLVVFAQRPGRLGMIYLLMFLVALLSWLLPWWWIVVPACILGMKVASGRNAFFVGFSGVFLVWAPLSYYFDLRSQGLASMRLAQLLALPLDSLAYVVSGTV